LRDGTGMGCIGEEAAAWAKDRADAIACNPTLGRAFSSWRGSDAGAATSVSTTKAGGGGHGREREEGVLETRVGMVHGTRLGFRGKRAHKDKGKGGV
jgi:hypothetical protein